MTDTLEQILASGSASAEQPVPDADERETLITDPVENKIGTEQVEGESPDNPTTPKEEPEPDKVGAAFKGVREGERKRYTEQIADFQKQLEARDAAWQAKLDALTAALTPQQPPPATPDFFENPQGAVRAEMEPVMRAIQAQREQTSLMMAAEKHGEQAVTEAYQWLASRKAENPQAFQADYARIMSAPHPYGELVKAHKQSQVLSEIGDDPASFKEKLRAEILAELQSGQSPAVPGNRSPAVPAMPSNFADARSAGPRNAGFTGPPSLQDIFSKG